MPVISTGSGTDFTADTRAMLPVREKLSTYSAPPVVHGKPSTMWSYYLRCAQEMLTAADRQHELMQELPRTTGLHHPTQ